MYRTYYISRNNTDPNYKRNLFKLFGKKYQQKIYLPYKDRTYARTRTEVIPDQTPLIECNPYISITGIGNPIDSYTTFKIPKTTGGYRTIEAPDNELKHKQKEIMYALIRQGVLPHDSAYAYIKGRSCKKAIERHLDNKSCWFLKIDLKDFFGSCNPDFVFNQLKKLEALRTNFIIHEIAKYAFLNNKLPQGTPLSPMLTNLVMVPIDHRINRDLPDGFVYTRYADDILISARESFDYKEIIKIIQKILRDTPLKINTKKTRYGNKNGRNFNLGIMYNKDMNLTVGHTRKKKIKALTHSFTQISQTLEEARVLNGELAYLKNIEPEYYNGLIKYFNKKYNCDIIRDIRAVIKKG